MELYNSNEMPLSSRIEIREVQEKIINGQQITMFEKVRLGRDNTIKYLDGYEFKPDHVYRAISPKMFEIYKQTGYIIGTGPDDEYIEYLENGQIYNNNKGIDWYLGGAAFKYGNIIIECPADKEYFTPSFDNGCGMASDITVRHMKSSGYINPVPLSMITKVMFVIKNIDHKTKQEISEEIAQIKAIDEEYKTQLTSTISLAEEKGLSK